MAPGGELIISATKGNTYVKMNKFPTADELFDMGFDVVNYKVPLTNIKGYESRFSDIKFWQTGGSSEIKPKDMITIILKKRS